MYQFTTPSVRYPLGTDRLLSRYTYDCGVSVLKNLDGTYTVREVPDEDALRTATKAYLGGRVYLIDDTEAAALTLAGLGAGLVEL